MPTIVSKKVTSSTGARSSTTGLVALLFGAVEERELPGVVLTALLGDLGVGPGAARRQLARMRADGQLGGVRTGRGVSYHLTGRFAATFERLRSPLAPPPWEGHFHALLFQVPETDRAYRDRLRRQAVFVGYGTLQPGVLIAARDRSAELHDVLAERPAGTVVRQARLAMEPADAVDAASAVWELPALAADLSARLPPLRAALAEAADLPADATTLRRMAALLNETTVELIRDPGLPTQLYPAGWPGPELGRTLGAVAQRYLVPVSAYVRSLLPG